MLSGRHKHSIKWRVMVWLGSLPLKAALHPAAVALLAQEQVRPLEDLLEGIDMSQLHRCIQMHKCLGRLPAFQVLQALP